MYPGVHMGTCVCVYLCWHGTGAGLAVVHVRVYFLCRCIFAYGYMRMCVYVWSLIRVHVYVSVCRYSTALNFRKLKKKKGN